MNTADSREIWIFPFYRCLYLRHALEKIGKSGDTLKGSVKKRTLIDIRKNLTPQPMITVCNSIVLDIVMANKVAPVPDSKLPSFTTSKTSSPFLDIMRTYVQSKMCYHPSALTNANVTNINNKAVAYQIDLWTLVDRRSAKQRERPYNAENTPREPLKNLWSYDFGHPKTVLKKKLKLTYDLMQTSWKTICPKCDGHGRYDCWSCDGRGLKHCTNCPTNYSTTYYTATCSSCHGSRLKKCSSCGGSGRIDCSRCSKRGILLHWYELKIVWYTIHSVSYQSNTPLPPKKIKKAPGKENSFTVDVIWSQTTSFDQYFQSKLATPLNSLVKIDQLTRDFNKKHLKKMKKDRRMIGLKCEIQRLGVTEVEYEIEGFTNKRDVNMGNRFHFYHYGIGKKNEPLVYENDYPLNACGCFGVGCAHYSKCCTVM
ncbi:unnamed protein product [Adineta ricciae]|uniref:Uncharacterized protein n=1 Tax=Adineta ricciae TaxID=249248 RepID=A0A813XHG6_ADIRI|nr:unnamed protein product [Adineta ricciae]